MINIEDKSKCSGCHACYNACPKNCITMKSDNEGFWYPSVDEKSCVDCGLCEKVCPILKVYKGYEKGKAYACVNKNSELRQKSSSTGVFSILAENVLDAGGVVFGAGFDENLKVRHISIKNKDDIRKIRGSKYVQSKIGDTYSEAKEYLQKGIKVLFAGTPCQISGLKSYLGKDYDNLILMDIICHGVPSPKVWKKYLDYIEKSNRKNIDKNNYPNFRSKRLGWGNFSMDINFTDGSVYTKSMKWDLYLRLFLQNIILRPSCYNCHSKSLNRESDITLADFWGVERFVPEMADDKGTSISLINTPKGNDIFNEVKDKLIYKEIDINDAVKFNKPSYQSVAKNPLREYYFEKFDEKNFGSLAKKVTGTSYTRKGINKIKKIIKKILKK